MGHGSINKIEDLRKSINRIKTGLSVHQTKLESLLIKKTKEELDEVFSLDDSGNLS